MREGERGRSSTSALSGDTELGVSTTPTLVFCRRVAHIHASVDIHALLAHVTNTSKTACLPSPHLYFIHTTTPRRYYGDALGATSATCAAQCPAGYFCPAGTINATEGKTADSPTGGVALYCRDTASYCPVGSPNPTLTVAGHYSVANAEGNHDTYVCLRRIH